MTGLSYASGSWYCLVRTQTVVLLPPTADRRLVEEVWEALSAGSGVERALTILSGDFQKGLSAVPPFAVVSFDDRLHVLLRGAVELTAAGMSETKVSGQGVTTWSERVLDAQDGWTLGVVDAAPAAGEEPLPLECGVVRAATLTRAATATAAPPMVVDQEPVLAVAPTLAPEPATFDDEASEETIHPGLFATADGTGPDDRAGSDEAAEDEAGQLEEEDEELPEHRAEEPEPVENTSGYDHLWGQTVMRHVEDAAVRLDGEDDASADGDSGTVQPGPESEPRPEQDPGPAVGPPAASAAPGTAAPVAGLSTGLIDSVPWARRPEAAPPEQHSAPEARDSESSELLGDHDGETVMKSSLPAGPEQDQAPDASAESRPSTGPTVLARLCAAGHANAPTVSVCTVCGQAVSGDTSQVRRPSLGKMRLSTGDVYELETSLIVGRQPSVSRVQGSVMPRLVQVTSEAGDISRSHVEVRLEGWHVMLCDLRATNGTVLIRSGQPPRRLGEGEMAILLDGDIAQLGQDVSLRFEDLR